MSWFALDGTRDLERRWQIAGRRKLAMQRPKAERLEWILDR
jgi:hypothetical protein